MNGLGVLRNSLYKNNEVQIAINMFNGFEACRVATTAIKLYCQNHDNHRESCEAFKILKKIGRKEESKSKSNTLYKQLHKQLVNIF